MASPSAGASLTLQNSTISGNTAVDGGGISLYYSEAVLTAVDDHEQHRDRRGRGPEATATGDPVGGRADPRRRRGSARRVGHDARARRTVPVRRPPNEVHSNGTIIAGNSGSDVGFEGTLFANHSLIGSIDAGTTDTDQGGNILGVDPVLGPLANNGGPTQTHDAAHRQPGDRPRRRAGAGVPGERVRPA